MMQMDGSIAESIREEARRAKAIAVEKYKAGDFAGAKEFAVKAKNLDPELCGLLRLNAVLDVRTAFAKKINGEFTDWYAVLAVDPTADHETIKKGFAKLSLDIILDGDDSVGSIHEAIKILADAWNHLCIENMKQSYDTRRRLHLILRIGEDSRRRDRLEITPNMIGSALVHNNVGAAEETKTLQDSNTSDMFNEEEPKIVVSVQDPDFYNFDRDRVEASFGENQVWAAYDDDGMPRFYGLVHSVVSQEPFKLCISWLNSKNNEELGTIMKWIDSGFYMTSGRFSIGERRNNESLNLFSHRVKWTKDAEGFVNIYPAKGDVWAVYTNWSPSWDSSTPQEVVNEYEMVEVIQDFSEEVGVMVMPLVKVPGFKTVFRRDSNPWAFSLKELLRFSHQVVSHMLTGEEGENAPEGCVELDPAALSPELLQVLTEEDIGELEN